MRAVVHALLVLLLAGCAGAPDPSVPDVERTWLAAKTYVPGRMLSTTPDQVNGAKPLPVVLYFHGCTGIFRHDHFWAEEFKSLGFVVIQPDSFARAERKPNCDPRTHQTGYFPRAAEMRDEEIRHAVERVRAMPWADKNRIFVMGHSEGGRAVTTNVVPGVRGTIISGWSCASRRTIWNGIAHPQTHPLLILEWEHDPWNAARGSCEAYLGGRTRTMFVRLKGDGHGSVESPAAREAARRFLLEQLRS